MELFSQITILGEIQPNKKFFPNLFFQAAFRLNKESYAAFSHCVQPEYRKIRTWKNSAFRQFLSDHSQIKNKNF